MLTIDERDEECVRLTVCVFSFFRITDMVGKWPRRGNSFFRRHYWVGNLVEFRLALNRERHHVLTFISAAD